MVVEVTIPSRSSEQRRAALQAANDVRITRAVMRRRLRASSFDGARAEVAGLLSEPPAWLESMYAMDLLQSMPRWGRVKSEKTLRRLDVSPRKTVGGLSERQRLVIIKALQGPVR